MLEFVHDPARNPALAWRGRSHSFSPLFVLDKNHQPLPKFLFPNRRSVQRGWAETNDRTWREPKHEARAINNKSGPGVGRFSIIAPDVPNRPKTFQRRSSSQADVRRGNRRRRHTAIVTYATYGTP
jgi:hypothetical protein